MPKELDAMDEFLKNNGAEVQDPAPISSVAETPKEDAMDIFLKQNQPESTETPAVEVSSPEPKDAMARFLQENKPIEKKSAVKAAIGALKEKLIPERSPVNTPSENVFMEIVRAIPGTQATPQAIS